MQHPAPALAPPHSLGQNLALILAALQRLGLPAPGETYHLPLQHHERAATELRAALDLSTLSLVRLVNAAHDVASALLPKPAPRLEPSQTAVRQSKRLTAATTHAGCDSLPNFAEVAHQTIAIIAREVAQPDPTEQHVRARAQLLRLLIDANPCCVAVRDATGRFLVANSALGAYWGLDPKDLLGRTTGELAALGKVDRAQLFRRESLYADVPSVGAAPLPRRHGFTLPDGTTEQYDLIHWPFTTGNGEPCVLELASSLTERNAPAEHHLLLQQQVWQAQKVEAVATLTRAMARQLSNILGPFATHADTQLTCQNWLRRLFPHFNETDRTSGRAEQLVRGIPAFSCDVDAPEPSTISIAAAICQAADLLRASLPASIGLETRLPSSPCLALAHGPQLLQVVLNLGINAAYAMRRLGGALCIELTPDVCPPSTPRRHPNLRPGPYARLRVSDTGEGMSQEVATRIFEPFFSTKPVSEGIGLGLAAVQGIVRTHQGSICVESEPNQGATFEIMLPTMAPRLVLQPSAAGPAPTTKETILFVDDELPLVRVGQRLLTRLGYSVIAHTSSLEALEAFREQARKIALLITDLSMPALTGLQLAEEVLQLRPELPIILTTGHLEDAIGDQARQLGLRAVAMKPYRGPDLARLIRQVLETDKLQ